MTLQLRKLRFRSQFVFVVGSLSVLACGSKVGSLAEASAGADGVGGTVGAGGAATAGVVGSSGANSGSSAIGGAPATCHPGDTRACVGPGACKGGQSCGDDERWSACDCGGDSGGGSAAGGTGGEAGDGAGASGSGGEASSAGGGSPPGVPGPSCAGIAKTCGPNRDDDCCASSVIPGGTFYRAYDGVDYNDKSYPATVSDFRLDTYEISVNRFNKFVDAYARDMIPQGAGKNPNNPADKGWDTGWNQYLKPSAEMLVTALQCPGDYFTFGQSTTSSFAVNCLALLHV